MSIDSREIYPNAPLQLVAFELRFPLALKLLSAESLGIVQESLTDQVPIVEGGLEGGMTINVPAGTQAMLQPQQFYKLVAKDRSASVTLQQAAVVVESSNYLRYAVFRALVERTLEALAGAVRLAGVTRVGLRYINEIRVPAEILQPEDWRAYVAAPLLEPLRVFRSLPAAEMMGRLLFDFGDGRQVTMNHGAIRQGEVVMSGGPLRVKQKDTRQPFFLIDVDSSWSPLDGLADFSPEAMLDMCDRLRTPARDLFEASITEELREQVLRKEAMDEHFGRRSADQGA